MNIVVTGSDGFIGKNLCIFLQEKHHKVLKINRKTSKNKSIEYLMQADFVFHLAGINRTLDLSEFNTGNLEFTRFIVDSLIKLDRSTPLVFTSSSQVEANNDYGESKLAAEKIVQTYSSKTSADIYIYRLKNVFGKWCKPNYNSFVATFCYNILNNIDISINNPKTPISLLYIDDVCKAFIGLLEEKKKPGFQEIPLEFNTTVGDVADIIYSFKSNRNNLIIERVGANLIRALYSCYLSYTTPSSFNYSIPRYEDERGVFCEMLKTKDSGQFSFFTAHPGITRGGHYHHSKSEKFLVIKGHANFKFENINTGERHELKVDGSKSEVVETIPGWTHDITNCGNEELIVMLWANEIFDREQPDTFPRELF